MARLIIRPRDPRGTAEIFYDERAGRPNDALIRYRNTWYVWTGSNYHKIDLETVRTALWAFLANAYHRVQVTMPSEEDAKAKVEWAERPFRPEPVDVSKVYEALLHWPDLRVPDTVSAPGWLAGASAGSGAYTHEPGNLRSVANGLVNLITGDRLPHTPYFLTMNAVDYAYDPEAQCPRFDQFLDEIFPGTVAERPEDFEVWDDARKDMQQRRELVLEIFGYLLSSDTRQQKLFLFMGKPRSGKGTLVRVLRWLIGEANAIGFELASLDNEFGLEDLIDKQVAIVGDARLDGKSHKAVSRLLSLSGEDPVTVNRKNEKKWHGTLSTRFLILTNPLLHFTDASGVIATRFVPVLFDESFLGRENLTLPEELRPELPGILNRTMEGLRRLRERGHFMLPPSSQEVLDRLARKAAPVLNFIDDKCELGADYEVEESVLFQSYTGWCEENNHRAMSKSSFVSALEDADTTIKRARPRACEGGQEKRPRVIRGIRKVSAPVSPLRLVR
jgi:P4 family phage/plasmid primase-like protien